MKKYVSIDIGGTEIKYGLIDEKGQILTRSKMKDRGLQRRTLHTGKKR